MSDIDKIGRGLATVLEATPVLTSLFSSGQNWQLQAACDAMRSWTWLFLDARRRDDPEMRELRDLLKDYETYLAGTHPETCGRIRSFAELLQESISFVEA